MRAHELLFNLNESRGVSARQPGDVYVSVTDPTKTITIIEVKLVRPDNAYAFDSKAELDGALTQVIPANGKRVNDNAPSSSSRAAIVAEVETNEGNREFWVRYVQDLMSAHGKWLTFRGYKYQASIESESLPIKPSDIIPDESPRTVKELLDTIDANLHTKLKDTPYAHMADLIDKVIEEAAGKNRPITFEKRSQAGIIAKYAGEYAGVIALLSDNIQNIKLSDIEARYGLTDLDKSKIVFPQSTTGMLIDSNLITPDGRQIGISSKMYKAGGAASSLLGIYRIMTPAIAEKFPTGAAIIKDLAALPAYSADPANAAALGPIQLALQLGIITDSDLKEIEQLPRNGRDVRVLKSDSLKKIIKAQGIAPGTNQRSDYSVFNHLLAAIVNILVHKVNNNPEFSAIVNAILLDTAYIQILTKVGVQGNNVTFTYYAKLPDTNKPFIYNKNYFATGNKGRIGFKLEK